VITPSTTGQAILKLQVNWRKRKIGGKGDEDIAGEQHSGEIDSRDPIFSHARCDLPSISSTFYAQLLR